MDIFLITLLVMLSVVLAMSVGYIFAKKVLKGSCGGLGRIFGESCMFCGKKEECEKKKAESLS